MSFSDSIHVERRNRGKRSNLSVPLVFSRFNTSRLYTQHQGFTCNHSPFGACIRAPQRYAPGTILFIRKDTDAGQIGATDAGGNNLARSTTLAEVRWCAADEKEKPPCGCLIGVRYL